MEPETVKLIVWIVATIVGLIWGWAKARYHLKEGKKAKVFEIAEEAVSAVYRDFVKGLKLDTKKAADGIDNHGKLTDEHIEYARKLAWAKAVDIGKEKGIDFAKEVAKEYFPVLIDKAIKAVKKK